MPKFAIFHSGSIESYFNQAMQYLDNKFQTYPSNIDPDITVSDAEGLAIAANDALARGIVAATSPSSVPKGNQVV